MALADSLSRLPITQETLPDTPASDITISLIQFSHAKLEELRTATREDPVLSRLAQYITTGFPDQRRDTDSSTRDFWPFRDELSIEDGIILKGSQVVIPEALRPRYLEAIHAGHQGTKRCQQPARTCIYWPGINGHIETAITQCDICQKYQASQRKEKPLSVADDEPNIPCWCCSISQSPYNARTYTHMCNFYFRTM